MAEKASFNSLTDFLRTEFYRGLAVGDASRRCHNCGRYFLLTAGYNTCCCNSIAPGETERTCRKVGAHRKANHPTGLSPAGMEKSGVAFSSSCPPPIPPESLRRFTVIVLPPLLISVLSSRWWLPAEWFPIACGFPLPGPSLARF
ncbi:DUF6076 domain-containing protein [uncultured Dysosmobacter sp.]|uniref:DUF6076 domain-containing protein n=1 Tax=uncultured Dysosmobacter sp. TaxID=2591384 RepID=UPI00345DF75A